MGWAILASLFVILLAATWRRWPDPIIDFGRDLYIPWLMSKGAALYRDIEHSYGPLSQSVNAMLFRVFGPTLTTLAATDAFLAGLLAILIYRILFVTTGNGAAFLGTLTYIAVFAFGNYTKITNYNFICPFSHEATHGLILCLAAFHAWQMAFLRRSLNAMGLAGLFTGLCFLARAETFVAAMALAVVALVLWTFTGTGSWKKTATALAIFCFFLALPASVWRLFTDLRSATGAWYVLLQSGAPTMPFYSGIMGMDHLGTNLLAMIVEFVGVLAIAILLVYLSLRLGNRPKAGAALVILLFLFMAFGPAQWMNTGRSIPLLVASVLALNVRRMWRDRKRPDANRQSLLLVLWGTLALALLIKLFAHVQLFHYGFYLALPATLLLIAAAMTDRENACAAMAHRMHIPLPPKSTSIVTAAIGAFVIAFCGQSLWISSGNYSYRTLAVGAGANRFFVLPQRLDERGPAVNACLDWCRQHMDPAATLAVLPEGVSLNFLSAHASSVRYINFSPFEFSAFREGRILSEFRAHPPDYIVLADRDVTEFGVAHFGVEGYGAEILRWVRQEYSPVFQIGPTPFTGPEFGMEILKHRSDNPRQPERALDRATPGAAQIGGTRRRSQ